MNIRLVYTYIQNSWRKFFNYSCSNNINTALKGLAGNSTKDDFLKKPKVYISDYSLFLYQAHIYSYICLVAQLVKQFECPRDFKHLRDQKITRTQQRKKKFTKRTTHPHITRIFPRTSNNIHKSKQKCQAIHHLSV